MTTPPLPVVFEPLYRPRPWGGRKLAERFARTLPPHEPVGESWEIVSLPGAESRVRDGPLAGRTLSELIALWGRRLVGGAELVDGRFPLLIKFLDAREWLSVQVHPSGTAPDAAPAQPAPRSAAAVPSGPDAMPALSTPAWGVKDEAWYVIDAEPGASLLIGCRDGVTRCDLEAAAGTRAIIDLLRPWRATPGACFFLPSGTPHALGAGILVAEVQTPSDVTYRMYDWDRVGLDGRPRELHVRQALANIRLDVAPIAIVQPRTHVAGVFATVTKLVACEHFLIDKLRLAAGTSQGFPHSEMVVWVVLSGRGAFHTDQAGHQPPSRPVAPRGSQPTEAGPTGPTSGQQQGRPESRDESAVCAFAAGDVVLVPADSERLRVTSDSNCEVLEVKVPVRSRLPRGVRREPEPPAALPSARGGTTPLTISGGGQSPRQV
jgi:mannose-6-phosphate isomerase